MSTGRRASRDQLGGAGERLRRRAGPAGRSSGPSGDAAGASDGSTCTSSGSTRWATPRPSRACLTASAASSAWSLPACTVVVVMATSLNTADRSRSWKAPRPSTLDGTWPEIAMTGRLVQLGVVQPGQQVGRARTGDREARRRPAGQLAVGAGRERGCALVPDADVGQLAALLGPAQRVGEAEVGVPDHAEHVRRRRARPGSRPARRRPCGRPATGSGQPHVDAVVALLDLVDADRVAEALPVARPVIGS